MGLAISDQILKVATPLMILQFRSIDHLASELTRIIGEYEVKEIVVGLPVNLKGEKGPAAQKTERLVGQLRERIQERWIFWDERLSSKEVERLLQTAEVSPEKRKQVRDSLAAQRILQNYLDSTMNRQHHPNE